MGVGKEVRVIVCLARPAGGAGPRAGRILLVLILHRDPAWSRGDACLVVGREPSPMCLGGERKGMGHDDAPGLPCSQVARRTKTGFTPMRRSETPSSAVHRADPHHPRSTPLTGMFMISI